jgi:hypothetical protein
VLILLVPILLGVGYLVLSQRGRPTGRSSGPLVVGASLLAVLVLLVVVRGGGGGDESPPATAKTATITAPLDSTTVGRPVVVKMAAANLVGSDHLHLMIDVPCVAPGHGVKRDNQHLHLGRGETEAVLDLAPGTHTLCLEAGNGGHVAEGLPDRVTIAVR